MKSLDERARFQRTLLTWLLSAGLIGMTSSSVATLAVLRPSDPDPMLRRMIYWGSRWGTDGKLIATLRPQEIRTWGWNTETTGKLDYRPQVLDGLIIPGKTPEWPRLYEVQWKVGLPMRSFTFSTYLVENKEGGIVMVCPNAQSLTRWRISPLGFVINSAVWGTPILLGVVWPLKRWQRWRQYKCTSCGYSLRGIPTRSSAAICPECGLSQQRYLTP